MRGVIGSVQSLVAAQFDLGLRPDAHSIYEKSSEDLT